MMSSAQQNHRSGPVVIAANGSAYSDLAVNFYLDRLHKTGMQIVIIHSIDMNKKYVKQIAALEDCITEEGKQKLIDKLSKHTEHSHKHVREEYTKILQERGITDGVIRSEIGKPEHTVLKVAADLDARLIVVGSRSSENHKKTKHSHITQHIMHHSKCPVVVCCHPLAKIPTTKRKTRWRSKSETIMLLAASASGEPRQRSYSHGNELHDNKHGRPRASSMKQQSNYEHSATPRRRMRAVSESVAQVRQVNFNLPDEMHKLSVKEGTNDMDIDTHL